MSGKDEYIFKKQSLLTTQSGRKIFKSGLIRDNKYKSFKFYVNKSKKEYDGFVQRYKEGIYGLIKADFSPLQTHRNFIKAIGDIHELELTSEEIETLRLKLEEPAELFDRIDRILNSNFIKMTFPVFYALFDGYAESARLHDDEMRNNLIDGHLIAIDLSEPMDRILDKDEDLEYLQDYKFINPYLLLLAKQKLSSTGPEVLKEFQSGFDDALLGQQIDYELKTKKLELTYDNLEQSYKKYRSVLGTAGRNMSLNQRPLSEIYYIGMAKAAECVGCGNEIQDAIVTKGIKSPSWPLFYSNLTHDVKSGFRLTLEKSKSYLSEASLALEMLDNDMKIKPFLEFLFLTVSHYNEFWYKELVTKRGDLLHRFQNELDKK